MGKWRCNARRISKQKQQQKAICLEPKRDFRCTGLCFIISHTYIYTIYNLDRVHNYRSQRSHFEHFLGQQRECTHAHTVCVREMHLKWFVIFGFSACNYTIVPEAQPVENHKLRNWGNTKTLGACNGMRCVRPQSAQCTLHSALHAKSNTLRTKRVGGTGQSIPGFCAFNRFPCALSRARSHACADSKKQVFAARQNIMESTRIQMHKSNIMMWVFMYVWECYR